MPQVFDHDCPPPDRLAAQTDSMPLPKRVLMCPPDHFAVIDVKNPHMAGHIGGIDPVKAREQWQQVANAFKAAGAEVFELAPLADCEDMVFCANPGFVGPRSDGTPVCLLSHMKYASRQREVEPFGAWFAEHGYAIERLPEGIAYEGGGDTVWHPGRRLIWGGYGYRTEQSAFDEVARVFDTPVIRLRLRSDRFYHLDTCFCAIDEKTVLINPAAFDAADVDLIRSQFANVIEAPEAEANEGLACNATALGGQHIVIQAGNEVTTDQLRTAGYAVHEVDTSEFLKSGGSVYCMKMYVF